MPVLNSWKEIATFLNRGVRTVQRWEKKNQLPVHRVGVGDKAPVFAFPVELQSWLRRIGSIEIEHYSEPCAKAVATDKQELERQRNLRRDLHQLLHEHRKKIAALQRTVEEMNKRALHHVPPARNLTSNFLSEERRAA
jgi:predicted HicB family RNase H-like nuclease